MPETINDSGTLIPRVDRITDYARQLWPHRTRKLLKTLLKLSQLSESGCLVWVGAHNGDGYGEIKVNGQKRMAHRVAYIMWVGEILEGELILHSCDNPPCISPYHLFRGNPLINRLDCISKGRSANYAGERNPQAKLKTSDVIEIRRVYKPRCRINGIAPLTTKYKISKWVIFKILARTAWKHVP